MFFVNCVYNTVFDGLLGVHPVVAVEILHDLLEFLAAVLGQYPGADVLYSAGLPGRDLQVDADSLHVSPQAGLVDHDLGQGIYETPPLSPATQQDRTHGGGQTHTDGTNGTLQHLHRVIDDKAGGHDATAAIDEEFDLFTRFVGFQQPHLGD